MSTVRYQVIIPFPAAGRRFDQVLAELFPDYSRSRLSAWIKTGAVTLNGALVLPRQQVYGGERVCLDAQLHTEVRSQPEAMVLDVVYEDDELLVLNKPVGLVVHPGAGHCAGTLLNALLYRDSALAQLPRAGIVHRLDKGTSGLMVVARTLSAMTALVGKLSRHEVQRHYIAVVEGRLVAGGTVDAPVARHPHQRVRQAVREQGRGKRAVTHYRVHERFRAHTLVECRLETGRTHQIRVHMAYIHHPLTGDLLYAGAPRPPRRATPALVATLQGFRHQALHAQYLRFTHPKSGDMVSFDAPPPDDFVELTSALRDDMAMYTSEQNLKSPCP